MDSHLSINFSELDRPSVLFKDPEEIGSFSLDINSAFENSRKSLKYFVRPSNPKNVRFDLRRGFDTRIIKEKGNDINVLHWINANIDKFPINPEVGNTRQCAGASGQASSMDATNHKGRQQGDDQESTDKELEDLETEIREMKINKSGESLSANPRKLGVDFVCRRGLLTKVMLSPYEDKEGWFIAVVYYNGTYYLNEILTEERKRREAEVKNNEMSCWGWKFEQYLTADTKDGQPNTDVPYNNCEKLYTVVKTELNKHSLVYSGEIDALNVDDVKGDYYMEFKTNKEFAHQGHIKTFKRFKTKKWWAQSHLIGIKTIVCGFRDESGVVKRLEFYDTKSLPDFARDVYNPWKPNVCTNFLDKFLTFIKDSIKIDDPKIVHTLKWSPGTRIVCSQPLKNSEYNFLPQWYIDGSA